MSRSFGLFALLALAIVSIVVAVGITGPVHVETDGHSKGEVTATGPAPTGDAGSLDFLLDGVRIEHQMQHGR
jgi:hypothetical protein